MTGVLVDYRCTVCARCVEHRVGSPPPGELPCTRCGAVAKRKYGFRVGVGRSEPVSVDGEADHGHPHGFGTCGLLPTAARALTARLSGDERALEREFRQQERMIAEGTLVPANGVHGVPPSSAAAATSAG